MNINYLVKSVIIGAEKTGKSYILHKLTNSANKSAYEPTIGVEFFSKATQFQYQHKQINTVVQIWDTAGDPRFQTIVEAYYKNSSVTFIVFDVNNAESFAKCKFYIQNIYQNCDQTFKQIMLVGTQLSDERKVSADEAFLFAMYHDIFYTEVKQDTDVELVLQKMIKSYIYIKLQ
ncbi:Rab11 [Hexamita inflata]|uniref:Rab11 n=1 Tax=Hexamita inflata TaxID=28002 RepID=A0ABP1HGA7_9EUKA